MYWGAWWTITMKDGHFQTWDMNYGILAAHLFAPWRLKPRFRKLLIIATTLVTQMSLWVHFIKLNTDDLAKQRPVFLPFKLGLVIVTFVLINTNILKLSNQNTEGNVCCWCFLLTVTLFKLKSSVKQTVSGPPQYQLLLRTLVTRWQHWVILLPPRQVHHGLCCLGPGDVWPDSGMNVQVCSCPHGHVRVF